MFAQVTTLMALVGLIGAGVLSASETRAFEALPFAGAGAAGQAGADRLCRVDVLRSGEPGSAVITRTESGDTCVCRVTTGPEGNNGTAEDVVNALLRDRTCRGAAPPVGQETASAGGGAGGAILGVVLAAGVGAGLAAGQGRDSNG